MLPARLIVVCTTHGMNKLSQSQKGTGTAIIVTSKEVKRIPNEGVVSSAANWMILGNIQPDGTAGGMTTTYCSYPSFHRSN